MKVLSLFCLLLFSTAHASQYSDFWSWFQTNEADFPSTLEFDAEYGDMVSSLLYEIQPGLTYEISVPESGQKELIISAGGKKDLIPSVDNLVNSAPALTGWDIIAFRPPLDDYADFTLDYGVHHFNPKELWCWSRTEGDNFDLIVFHPDYTDESRPLLVSGTYILLDMALGEYEVMTGVRYIDHRELPDNPRSAGLYKFGELRDVYDKFKSTVEL